MRIQSLNRTRKRSTRFARRLKEAAIQKQMNAYKKLVLAGIDLVQFWAISGAIEEDHIAVLSAIMAFVDSSYASEKDRKAKTDALGLALRSAYLYGKHGGVPPQPITDPEQPDETDEKPVG